MNPMTIEYKIHIDPQQIRIQDPQTGYHEEMSNRAVVLPKDRLVLGLGESEEKVRARLIARFQKSANDLRTLALFGPRGDDLDYEIQVLQFLARLLNTQSLSVRGWRHYGALLGSDFDYNLEIPGYESFSEARRHALEHNFQARQPLRRLAINGQEVQIPPSKRRLELWARVQPGAAHHRHRAGLLVDAAFDGGQLVHLFYLPDRHRLPVLLRRARGVDAAGAQAGAARLLHEQATGQPPAHLADRLVAGAEGLGHAASR
jgi:hypothetical protein